MKKTTKYEIFEFHPNNRKICETNLKKIIRSIETRNLLEHRPILVDSEMRVIDGQHRLEAAKRLGVEVFYEVHESLKKNDIILLNENSKVWDKEDYLNYYCNEGNLDYLNLRNFMKKNMVSCSIALVILGQNGGSAENRITSNSATGSFKQGDYKFPSKADEEASIQIMENSNELISYAYPKIEGRPHF